MLNIFNYYSICGTLNFVGTTEKLRKIVDYWKTKFLPWPLDRVFKRNISLLVNIYKESLEALSYG